MIYHITRATRHFLLWSLIVLAIGSVSIRVLILGIEGYKTNLENKIFELTEIPIEIGTLRADMRGFSPEIILKDIQVLAKDANGKPAIQLKEMRLGINPVQLLFSWEVLPSSWLTLVGVKLSIVRKEDGALSIVGLNMEESGQPLWLLQGDHYEILNSDISWLDEQRKGERLVFNKVDLSIRNDSETDTHEIHFISHLPPKYGEILRVSMSFQGNVFEVDNINGMVYAEGSDINLAELVTTEQPLGIKIVAGKGSFKKWSKVDKSRLTAVTGSVQAKNIVLQKQDKAHDIFEINTLSTTFNGFKKEDGWQLGLKDFALETRKQTWPIAEFSIFADETFSRLAGSITQLDLQELTELLEFFVPLDVEKHALISKLGLKGMLKAFSIYADSGKNQYAINGVFDNLFINAFSGMPELKNLSGSIKGTNENGIVALNTINGSLFYPDIFRKPLTINKLHGMLEWQQMPDKWQIGSKSLALDTKDIQTQTRMAVTIPKNNDGAIFMDLQASFANAEDISQAPIYYPAFIMDKEVLNWLDNAFVSGKIERGDVLVYGELDKFPFSDGQGVFEVLYNMRDVDLHFNPEWPNLKNVAADVLFLKNSVTIDISHAEVNGLVVKRTLLEIPSFSNSNYLLVQGQVEGLIVDGLTYLQRTPLHESASGVLDVITPVGSTQVKLDMKIPIAENFAVDVDGKAQFKDASLNVKSVDLNVENMVGDLRFTENGLFGKNIKAKTLGYPIDINVDSDNLKTSINIAGKTNILQLKKQFDFLKSEFIDEEITGSTEYKVKLDLPVNENKPAELSIKTNLSGVSIDLPGSLSKQAKQKRPLSVTLLLNDKELLPISLNYNDNLKAAININKQQSVMHSAHIVYGNGKAVSPLIKGINIDVEKDFFDVSEWMEFAGQGDNEEQEAEDRINGISIITRQLQWKNKKHGAFEIAMQRFDQQWQGNLSCSIAKGAFVIPINYTGKDKIKLDMVYLNLSQLMQTEIQVESFTTEDMPLINVLSDQLWWNGVDLGVLEIETERLVDGVRFKRINVTADDHKIELRAEWIKNDTGFLTEMSGSIQADDFGAFLSGAGFTNDLKDSSGKVKYKGVWPGAPYQFSLLNMDAELDIAFKDGRISSIEPGFGRILGLIAIEQWVERLTLDFSDVYKQGLSFNSITGHFKMNNGKAITNDLLVDAIPALISINGEADLLTKALDYRVSVVPKSSEAVPIAGTIVSSIAEVITRAFANDYKEGYFFGSMYMVTGKWNDMEITPLHEQDGLLKKTWTGLTDFSWMKPTAEQ